MRTDLLSIERVVPVRPGREAGKIEDDASGAVRIAQAGERQTVTVYQSEPREYRAPFNHDNFSVELGPKGESNTDGVELDVPPLDAITVVEDELIIGLTVIGSACTPPGTGALEAEPCE